LEAVTSYDLYQARLQDEMTEGACENVQSIYTPRFGTTDF